MIINLILNSKMRLVRVSVKVKGKRPLPVTKRNVSELFSSGPVNRVRKARVVSVQLRAVRQNLIREPVELSDVHRKPGDVIPFLFIQLVTLEFFLTLAENRLYSKIFR